MCHRKYISVPQGLYPCITGSVSVCHKEYIRVSQEVYPFATGSISVYHIKHITIRKEAYHVVRDWEKLMNQILMLQIFPRIYRISIFIMKYLYPSPKIRPAVRYADFQKIDIVTIYS